MPSSCGKPQILQHLFFVFLICTGVCWAANGGGPAKESSEVQPIIIPITSHNRHYPGIMFGGWGPHLRALMRAPNGSLWLPIDEGPNVQHNEQVVYFTFDGSCWREAAR